MKNTRKKSQQNWLTFYAGAVAGLSAGLVVSPIWWIVDTIGILLGLVGNGLSATGKAVRGQTRKVTEKGDDAAVVSVVEEPVNAT